MNGTKRLLMSMMVLCFVLVGLLTPEKAYATSDSDFVIENGVLTRYQGSAGDVVIPDGVTKIGDMAFGNCINLISVVMPNGITEIGDYAFSRCSKLTSVEIPNSVTLIGSNAFNKTPWLDKKRTERDDHLVIINTILADAMNAQGNVIIPDGVTKISGYAFSNCISLTSVIIPNSVTEIGYGAFSDCSNLTSVVIPNSVTTIGSMVFSNTPWLDKKRTERADHLVIINNILIDGEMSQGKVRIPNGVTEIGSNSFGGSSLTSVVISDSVIEIGESAFWGCSKLTSVVIPDSVTTIGTSAFWGCSKLKEITIPKNVTKLGVHILGDCDALSKITILNKKVNFIELAAIYNGKLTGSEYYFQTLIGDTSSSKKLKKPTKVLTICGYKYSASDEFAVLLNTLQAKGKIFGIKSVKFIPLDNVKKTLDKVEVPESITITKGKSKKLSITLPSTLKRVDKFTKKKGQVKISITYSKEIFKYEDVFLYDTKKVFNDTIKAKEKGIGYAYTTVTLPNGDKKVFATKITVK